MDCQHGVVEEELSLSQLFVVRGSGLLGGLSFGDEEDEVEAEKPSESYISRVPRRMKAFALRSRGYAHRSAMQWAKLVERDRAASGNGASAEGKKAAYKAGFIPQVLGNMGLDASSCHERLSVRDYLYLYPVNGKYDKWIRDRVSALNVFGAHKDHFELNHFHIIRRDGEPFFIALSDAAKGVSPDLEGLAAMLREKDCLTIASASWSKSAFWQVRASEDGFLLDGVKLSFADMHEWLTIVAKRYALVVLEPLRTSEGFEEIAPGSVSSIRVRMLNKDGNTPCAAQSLVVLEYDAPAAREREEVPADAVIACQDEEEHRRLLLLLALRKPNCKKYLYASVGEDGAFANLRFKGTDGKVAESLRAPECAAAFQGIIPGWKNVTAELSAMCRFVPQLEFAEFELRMTGGNFVITNITSLPPYNDVVPFTPAIDEFLLAKTAMKRKAYSSIMDSLKRYAFNLRRKIRRTYASIVAPKGLVVYQSTRWPGDVIRDFRSKNGRSISQKLWAYRYGFLSYRIPQYGITPENRRNFISDFEYRWLRHINTKYKYWLEDKITLKYIASDFKECFPGYYYYTSLKDGENRVIPMMDIPEGFGATYEDIIRLAKEMKMLALKPDEGSHGEGFYCLAWDGETFTLNGQAASEEDVLAVLKNPANQYLITEYIQMHPQLKEIYPGSVNTIRVTVFKRDGRKAEIGNAYMRIGSSRTGFVDNLAAGGIAATVDIETGRYGNATILDGINQGNLVPCPIHPDTGVTIEGVLPNWEYAKEKVLGIAEGIPQLEYFGFDLAITEDGIKLPEINRFPDFPRIVNLTPQIIDYLLYKLERKKRVYGYDEKPCRRILSLPKR